MHPARHAQGKAQGLLDRVAISGSALCVLHCLASPLLLVAVPVFSSTFLADQHFHIATTLLGEPRLCRHDAC
jgi:hypothetical protein